MSPWSSTASPAPLSAGRWPTITKLALITAAVRMAARRLTIPANAVFHSDYAEDFVKPRNLCLALS